MTPARLRQCLDALGWSQGELGRMAGYHVATARQWARGRLPIPPEVALWIEAMVRERDGQPDA